MDRTELTVRNMLTAVEAPLYDIGVLSDRGMLPGLDGIPAAAVLDRLSLLKYRNVRGSHIYMRPSGEHRFTVLDDLKEGLLARLSDDGFNPCAVVETSTGNFQAWLKPGYKYKDATMLFACISFGPVHRKPGLQLGTPLAFVFRWSSRGPFRIRTIEHVSKNAYFWNQLLSEHQSGQARRQTDECQCWAYFAKKRPDSELTNILTVLRYPNSEGTPHSSPVNRPLHQRF